MTSLIFIRDFSLIGFSMIAAVIIWIILGRFIEKYRIRQFEKYVHSLLKIKAG